MIGTFSNGMDFFLIALHIIYESDSSGVLSLHFVWCKYATYFKFIGNIYKKSATYIWKMEIILS